MQRGEKMAEWIQVLKERKHKGLSSTKMEKKGANLAKPLAP